MGGTARCQVFHSKHFALNGGNNALTYVRYIRTQKIKEMHDQITLRTMFFPLLDRKEPAWRSNEFLLDFLKFTVCKIACLAAVIGC